MTIIEAYAGKKLIDLVYNSFKNIISDLSSGRKIKLEMQSLFNELIITERIEDIELSASKYVDKLLKFKTINPENTFIFIDDIYTPLTLRDLSNKNNTKIIIDEVNVISFNKINCIIGKAGQGKTTLMRKLAYRELLKEEKIPLIIILRDIKWESNLSLLDVIKYSLKHIGFPFKNEETIAFLLQSNKILPLFDGFDEIKYEDRSKAINLIESCYQTYNSTCYVTTRPNTEITTSISSSKNWLIEDLSKGDVVNIINDNKTIDGEFKLELIKSLSYGLKEILITPIIVDIYIYTYPSLDSTPNNSIELYKELFNVLAKNMIN